MVLIISEIDMHFLSLIHPTKGVAKFCLREGKELSSRVVMYYSCISGEKMCQDMECLGKT